MSEEMKDFVVKILDKNPKNRLGVNGSEDIKNHPWFSGIDFAALQRKEIPAPFRPEVEELNYESASVEMFEETVIDDMQKKLVEENQEQFSNF